MVERKEETQTRKEGRKEKKRTMKILKRNSKR